MIHETTQAATAEQGQQESAIIQLPPGGVALVDVERELVRQAMERAHGNQTHAAQLLHIERDALRRRLIKFGLLPHEPPTHSGKN